MPCEINKVFVQLFLTPLFVFCRKVIRNNLLKKWIEILFLTHKKQLISFLNEKLKWSVLFFHEIPESLGGAKEKGGDSAIRCELLWENIYYL